jgi:hypothetical protein
MAGWHGPVPAPERMLAPGILGKCYRDALQAAAPGRNLRNWPFRNYIRPPTGRTDPHQTAFSDGLDHGHYHDRGHDYDCGASPNNVVER